QAVEHVQTLGQVLEVAGNRAAQFPAPFLILWMTGFALAAARALSGAVGTSRMVRHAPAASYANQTLEDLRQALGIRLPVRVLESPAAARPVLMPIMWGILRPVAVLP